MDAIINTRRKVKETGGNSAEIRLDVLPSFLNKGSYLYFWRKGRIVFRHRVICTDRVMGIVTLCAEREYLKEPLAYPEFAGFKELRVPECLEVGPYGADG